VGAALARPRRLHVQSLRSSLRRRAGVAAGPHVPAQHRLARRDELLRECLRRLDPPSPRPHQPDETGRRVI
jgi:hypothetical protein